MLQPLSLKDRLPTLKPPGSGGRPGRGSRPERPPARGGLAFHPTLTIISNPPHPDNDRQTIIQASSPPQLKIPKEIRLPNILIGSLPPPPPRPAPPPPKPIETHVVVPPRATVAPPSAPLLALVPPRNPLPNPSMPVPLPAAPAAPAPPAPAPQPTPQPAPPAQATEAADAKALAELDTRKTSAANAGLISLSVDPAPPTESVTLPPGNRQGAFSISPEEANPALRAAFRVGIRLEEAPAGMGRPAIQARVLVLEKKAAGEQLLLNPVLDRMSASRAPLETGTRSCPPSSAPLRFIPWPIPAYRAR